MKIKLPLRVEKMWSFYDIVDDNGITLARSQYQQTAQLFADCFEEIAGGGHTDPDPCFCRTDYVIFDVSRDLAERAAEAVEDEL